MRYQPDMPLIVQSDRTVLLETNHPQFREVRDQLSLFAELEKSPEYIHTYRISPLSLWNAAAGGMTAEQILDVLYRYGKYAIPLHIENEVREYVGRYGLLKLRKVEGSEQFLQLVSEDEGLLRELTDYESLRAWFAPPQPGIPYPVPALHRGVVKQEFMKLGYPLQDLAGYTDGDPFSISLKDITTGRVPFVLRSYQQEAVDSFYAGGSEYGGSGVLVLPCGAGKTVIGIAAMAKLCTETLILTTNTTSVNQWIREILDKTNVQEQDIGSYTGERKDVRPITVATYQILTHRDSREGEFSHMSIFNRKNWGLIIYDEVHLLPAPVFRATAGIQAKRRLGLTATLVREDRREGDVFTLVGPKKYDIPWKRLEDAGWIAGASCVEIRTPMETEWREKYAVTATRQKYRVAAGNPRKIHVLERLLVRHRHDHVLVIGQYLDQLREAARRFHVPLITGEVSQEERERLYGLFKKGDIKVLIVSKVANFAVDLPDANVAIQISGTFGSRQEEAQRLGRILRPKQRDNRAYFYTLVSRDTNDQEYAMKRQLFLVEQGYRYQIVDAEMMEQLEW